MAGSLEAIIGIHQSGLSGAQFSREDRIALADRHPVVRKRHTAIRGRLAARPIHFDVADVGVARASADGGILFQPEDDSEVLAELAFGQLCKPRIGAFGCFGTGPTAKG